MTSQSQQSLAGRPSTCSTLPLFRSSLSDLVVRSDAALQKLGPRGRPGVEVQPQRGGAAEKLVLAASERVVEAAGGAGGAGGASLRQPHPEGSAAASLGLLQLLAHQPREDPRDPDLPDGPPQCR